MTTRVSVFQEAMAAFLAIAYAAAIIGCWVILDPTPDRANPSPRPRAAALRPCADDSGVSQKPRDAIALWLSAN